MWFLFFTSFGLAGCLMAFSGSWSIPYLMQVYGFSRTHSANFMLAVILGKIVGFPLIGYLSDRFVRRKAPLLIFFSIHILLWAVFWSMGKPPANVLMAIFFFMGLSSGALMLIITLAKETNQPAYAGTAMSVVNIAPFLGVSCIQPLLGYALELRWAGLITLGAKVYPLAAYRLLFAACLTVLLISFCFALQIKEAK
jgi:sugar phosphate permease